MSLVAIVFVSNVQASDLEGEKQVLAIEALFTEIGNITPTIEATSPLHAHKAHLDGKTLAHVLAHTSTTPAPAMLGGAATDKVAMTNEFDATAKGNGEYLVALSKTYILAETHADGHLAVKKKVASTLTYTVVESNGTFSVDTDSIVLK
mgnify:FL=1